MTNIWTQGFVVNPDGTVLNEGNTGYDAVSNNNAVSDTNEVTPYSGTHSAKVVLSAATWTAKEVIVPGTNGIAYNGVAINMADLFTGPSAILQFHNSGTIRCQVRILADGTVQLRNGVNAIWDSVTNLTPDVRLAADQHYHLEHYCSSTLGQQRVRVWDSTGAQIIDSGNQTYNQGTFNEAVIGCANAITATVFFGRHVVDNADWTGPINASVAHTRTINEQLDIISTILSSTVNLIFLQDFNNRQASDEGSAITELQTDYSNITGAFVWDNDDVRPGYDGNTLSDMGALLDVINGNGVFNYNFPGAVAYSKIFNGAGLSLLTYPSTASGFLGVEDVNTGVVQAAVRILPDGRLQLRDGNISAGWTSFYALPLYQVGTSEGAWHHIEHYVDADLNIQRVRIYSYAGTLIEDSGNWPYTAGEQLIAAKVGLINNTTCKLELDHHTIAIADWIGPVAHSAFFDRSQTDSTGLVDEVSKTITKLIDDSIDITSLVNASFTAAWFASINDSTFLTDAITTGKNYDVIIDELITVIEPESESKIVEDSLSDPVNTSDGTLTSGSLDIARTIDDGLNLTEMLAVGYAFGPTINDSLELTDDIVQLLGLAQTSEVNDVLGLTDEIATVLDIVANPTQFDSVDLTDTVQINLFTLTPSLSETVNLRDTISVFKNGALVSDFASEQDLIFAWLSGLGYTGTIQDMQYAYLKDQYIATVGPLPTAYSLSSADLQVALGLTVKDLIDQAISSGNNFTITEDDIEGLTELLVLQGQFFPKEALSSQDNSAGSSATTASFTPKKSPDGRLYYIWVTGIATTAGTAADPTSVVANANGAAFTKLVGVNTANGNLNLSLWAIDADDISGAGTITITYAASQNSIQWHLLELLGIKIVATLSFGRKQAIVTATNATTTPSVSLGSAPTNGGVVLCAMAYNAAQAQSVTKDANAELTGTVLKAPSDSCQLAVEADSVNALSQTLGWTTGNNSGKVLAIVELEAA